MSEAPACFLASALLLLTGCPADDVEESGAASTSGSSGPSADASTSAPASTTVGTDGSTTDAADTSTGGDGQLDYDPQRLGCPVPASLPFEVEASGFENDASATAAADLIRFKDEASDILGNPGGVLAFTTMELTASPAAGSSVVEGRKQRTTVPDGLAATAFAGEWVSLWRYDGESWSQLDRQMTGDEGEYAFTDVELSNNNLQPLYAVLEGDGTCTPHFTFLLEPGTPVVLTDIDGTMTLSDEELSQQIADGDYVPEQNGSASALTQLWTEKGYQVVYLTARPHLFRSETRTWLRDQGFATGPLITSNTLVFGDSAEIYKSTWVSRVTDELGWNIVAAYGDASSDIGAYEEAGIPKEITFIVGENAGTEGTQAILDNDYAQHIADFVEPFPDAQ
ncbi:MAG: HAD family acid phosphatase [Myxococcota bacterium]